MKANVKPELTTSWWNSNKPKAWSDNRLEAALAAYDQARLRLQKEHTEEAFELASNRLDAIAKAEAASAGIAKKGPQKKDLQAAKVKDKEIEQEKKEYQNTAAALKKFGSYITLERKQLEDLVEEEDEAGVLLNEDRYKKYLKQTMKRMQRKTYHFALGLDKPSCPEGHRFIFHKTKPGKKLGLGLVDEVEWLQKKKLTWGMAGADTEDGKTMVLMLEHKQLPGMEKHCQKFLKKFKPLPFEQIKLISAETGEVLPDIPDPEDTDVETTTDPDLMAGHDKWAPEIKQRGDEEEGVDPGRLFKGRLQALMPDFKKSLATRSSLRPELKLRSGEAKQLAQQKEFTRANAVLDELERLVQEVLAGVPLGAPQDDKEAIQNKNLDQLLEMVGGQEGDSELINKRMEELIEKCVDLGQLKRAANQNGPHQAAAVARMAERKAWAAWKKRHDEVKQALAVAEARFMQTLPMVRRQLNVAEDAAAQHNYELATAETDATKKLLASRQRTHEQLAKKRLLQLKHEAEYQASLEKYEARLATLSGYRGIAEVLQKYQAGIVAAQAQAAQGDFVAACELLKALQKLPGEKSCSSKSRKALSDYDGQDPAFAKVREEAEQALVALSALALPDELKTNRKLVDGLIDAVVASQGAEESFEELQKRVAAIAQRTDELQQRAQTVGRNLPKIDDLQMRLSELAGPYITSIYAMRRGWLKAAIDTDRWDEAAPQSTELYAELVEAEQTYREAQARWTKAAANVKDVGEKLREMQECPPARLEARLLRGRLVSLDRIATVDPRDPDAALTALDEIRTETDRLADEVYGPWQAMQSERETATTARAKFLDDARQALADLKAALAQARSASPPPDGDNVFVPYQSEVAAFGEHWQQVLTDALTSADLDRKTFESESSALLRKITDAATDTNIGASVAMQKLDETRRAFDADWIGFEHKIDELSAADATHAEKLLAAGSATKSVAGDDYDHAIAKLQQVTAQVEQALNDARAERTTVLKAVQEDRVRVVKKLNELKKKVRNKLFQPFFAEAVAEIKDLGVMMKSPNVDTLHEATDRLDDLHDRFLTLLNQATGEVGEENFKTVAAELKEIKKILGNKVLSQFAPRRLELLNTRLQDLEREIASQVPSESIASLRDLRQSSEEAYQTALQAKELRASFSKYIKFVTRKLKRLKKTAPCYYEEAQGRVKALTANSKTEGSEQQALRDLVSLHGELNLAINNPALQLERDTAARQQELQAKQEQIAYQTRLKVYRKVDYRRTQAAVSNVKGDQTLIAELDRMRKAMQKVAKSGDYAAANQQLDLLKQRARDAVKRPYGPTIGAQNKLPQDRDVFQASVRQYNKAMEKFYPAIEALEGERTELEARTKQAIRNMMQSTTNDFVLTAFDKVAAALMDKKTTLGKRRTAREEGLAIVRQYETLLHNSQVMRELVTNPIETENIPAAMSGLYYALNRLQGNILRSCK